jgi:radical SAM protein with 4Fe4S-binding SPASM domain
LQREVTSSDLIFPVKAEGLLFRRLGEQWAVVREQDPTPHIINEMGRLIIDLCAGKTLRDILEHISSLFPDVPENILRRDVVSFIDQLIRMEIIGLRAELGTGITPEDSPTLIKISHMYLCLTNACNLQCKHCYTSSGTKFPDELSTEHFLHAIREFAKIGGKYLTVAGGEPMMHRDWQAICTEGEKNGLLVTIITNATLISEGVARFIADHNFGVGVSLDGATSSTHDFVRGSGRFDQTNRGLDILLKVVPHEKIAICFTPMKSNLKEIDALFDLALKKGVKQIYVNLFEPRGRGQEFRAVLEPSSDERITILKELSEESAENNGKIQVEISQGLYPVTLQNATLTGKEVSETICVWSTGEVYLTTFLSDPNFRLGNVKGQSIGEICGTSKFKELATSLNTRHEHILPCKECVCKSFCRGGGAGLAFLKSGTIMVPDEYCEAKLAMFDSVVEDMMKEESQVK